MDLRINLSVEAISRNVDFFPSEEETEEMLKELFTNEGFEVVSLNLEEYEEYIDWSKIPIDTPILVRDKKSCPWIKRYFSGYVGNKVCAFDDNLTSKSYFGITPWKYAKLAESEV